MSNLDLPTLLDFALQTSASDVHLTSGQPPVMRVHGELKRVDVPALGAEEARQLVFALMNEAQRRVLEEKYEIDFSYALGDRARFRVNAFVDQRGFAAVLRAVPSTVPSIDSLALPSIARSLCERDSGLVLVTGPTGSGKSTTLAAMIGELNERTASRIITIEDPIEFLHSSNRSMISQRELGMHTRSFAGALRAALREDPDVVLVGEMRDLETISLALTAAETGHLVFSTLHSPSAAQTIDRIIDVYPPAQQGQVRAQLSESLAAVLTQRLLPRVGGGRVAAFEVLVGVPAARALIRDAKTHQLASVMQVGQKDGMRTMEAALLDLLQRGVVRAEDLVGLLPDRGHEPAARAAGARA